MPVAYMGRVRSLTTSSERSPLALCSRQGDRRQWRPSSLLALLFLVSLPGLPFTSQAFEIPVPERFHNGLSLQGFTGILNTPNAHVTDEGSLYALYSNQEEPWWRASSPYQDNYLLSLGFFSFAEGGARLTARPGAQNRDLSANVKFSSAPLTLRHPGLPVLALGMQDLAGGLLLQTKYAVVTQDFWRFRLSAGYGSGPSRMKGLFGGVEFKAHEWVYLLADYDTKERNVGARIITPQFRNFPVQVTATAKTSLDYRPGNFEIAAGLTFPLDFSNKEKAPQMTLREPAAVANAGEADHGQGAKHEGPGEIGDARVRIADAADVNLSELRDRLVKEGFINTRIGVTDSGILVVEYENARFNHNELDGLGVVAGIVARHAQGRFELLRIVLKRHDIPMLQFAVPQRALAGFLDGSVDPAALNEVLEISSDAAKDQTDFLSGTGNPGFLKSSLLLYPGLTTFVGTEYGVFDYLLTLKPELQVNAWKGGLLDVRWDIPVAWSENLDDGEIYRDSRQPSRMDRFMFFQAFKPLPTVMANLGAGMILHDIYGTLNEATWSPGNGDHRFRVAQAYGKDSDSKRVSTVYLGSYRYYFSPLDLSVEATGGRFWAQDQGGRLELKRYFGDTAISFYYSNTKGSDQKKWQSAGVQFSFPLTPRRDMKHLGPVQVRGSEEWSYAQETTLKNRNTADTRGALNYHAPYPLAVNPLPTTALYRAYYNRDRLSESYIRKHLDRLRDAWGNYGSHP